MSNNQYNNRRSNYNNNYNSNYNNNGYRNNRNNGNNYRNNRNYQGNGRSNFNRNSNFQSNSNRNNRSNRSQTRDFLLTPKPPLSYEAKKDKQKRAKIKWNAVNLNFEAELPIYDDTTMEDYLRTVREFYSLTGTHQHLTNDASVDGTTAIFQQALRGQASMSFQFQLQQLQNGRATSYNELRIAIQETSTMILGHDAHENQLNYLKFTKKPRELTIDEWFWRILNINLSLPYMSADGEQPLRARTLLKEVVMKNIPPAL